MLVVAFATDLHLRTSVPRCRTESQFEWLGVQRHKLVQFVNGAIRANADIICFGGDSYHQSTFSWYWCRALHDLILKHSKIQWVFQPGNHDRAMSEEDLALASPYGILGALSNCHISSLDIQKDGRTYTIRSTPPMTDTQFLESKTFGPEEGCDVLLMHGPVAENCPKTIFPIEALARTKAKVVLAGHIHTGFAEVRSEGQVIWSPGCLVRQRLDDFDHDPAWGLVTVGDEIKIEKHLVKCSPAAEVCRTEEIKKLEGEDFEGFIEALRSVPELQKLSLEDLVRGVAEKADAKADAVGKALALLHDAER